MNDQQPLVSVTRVVDLLVAKQYGALEVLTNGRRLTAADFAEAIEEYGRTLVAPPPEGYELMDVLEPPGEPRMWMVDMPLWTEEEGRSDLTLQLRVIDEGEGVSIEVDDIHVL